MAAPSCAHTWYPSRAGVYASRRRDGTRGLADTGPPAAPGTKATGTELITVVDTEDSLHHTRSRCGLQHAGVPSPQVAAPARCSPHAGAAAGPPCAHAGYSPRVGVHTSLRLDGEAVPHRRAECGRRDRGPGRAEPLASRRIQAQQNEWREEGPSVTGRSTPTRVETQTSAHRFAAARKPLSPKDHPNAGRLCIPHAVCRVTTPPAVRHRRD